MSNEAENDDVKRQLDPRRESMSPVEKEQSPTYYQRLVEREGRSEWSGGSWGGRSR
ncbi:MAG: hypothetical protein ABR910_13015 [Acidobacteriaceae bacterium]|jgi:hypothetical protein